MLVSCQNLIIHHIHIIISLLYLFTKKKTHLGLPGDRSSCRHWCHHMALLQTGRDSTTIASNCRLWTNALEGLCYEGSI